MEAQQQQRQQTEVTSKANNEVTGQIKVNFYTDPLCCWSWAFEQSWRKLLEEYKQVLSYEYVMGGMIPDWSTYNDPMNAVSKPLQMGPVWMHAAEVTHVKMMYSIWHEDPPSSSYPPCIAVKCARLQSKEAAELYLYNLRKALMEQGLNISKTDNLFAIASSLSQSNPDIFNYDEFDRSWKDGTGKEAFRSDLQKTKFHNISRYPTLTFNAGAEGFMIVGYRPYQVLLEGFLQIMNELKVGTG